MTKSEISFQPDLKKVPIAIINGQLIHDSNNIIDAITSSLLKESSRKFDAKVFLSSDTAQWNEWSEKKLAVMLYPNITRSFAESWDCFGYSSDVESWSAVQRYLVRVIGPIAMYFVNGKIKKKYGIVNEREELHTLLLDWTGALGANKFLHGDELSLPDVLVFGVLRSIAGTQTHREVLERNAVLQKWYSDMQQAVPSHEVK